MTQRKRSKPKTTIPIAMIAGFAPLAAQGAGYVQTGGIAGLGNLTRHMIPYDPVTRKFTTAYLGTGLIPILGGWLVHKIAGMVGINRALSGIPLIRV